KAIVSSAMSRCFSLRLLQRCCAPHRSSPNHEKRGPGWNRGIHARSYERPLHFLLERPVQNHRAHCGCKPNCWPAETLRETNTSRVRGPVKLRSDLRLLQTHTDKRLTGGRAC